MKIKGLSIESIEIQNVNPADYTYALVTEMSRVRLLEGEAVSGYVIGEELLEARYFDEKKELHIWKEGNSFRAVLVRETGKTDAVRKKPFPVTGSVCADGKLLCAVQYLTYDEDGQACVGLTRLCGVTEGGTTDGKVS